MKFGPIPTPEAGGAILAHSQPLASGKLSKGHRLQADDLARLQAEEVNTIIVCRLEPGDLMEDEAADRLSAVIDLRGLTRSPASTGRVNFYASANGLFRANKTLVDRFNAVDPAITLACLADRRDVRAGDLVATVKIIPLAVAGARVMEAAAILQEGIAFEVALYRRHRVHLVATQLPSLKPSVMDKTTRVLEARLAPSASRLASEHRVPHRADAVADAIRASLYDRAGAEDGPPLIIVFGASAVADADDVIPLAIRLAGGVVDQVGLPVDPGNLLVLGHVGDVPVIGAPGCARSPKENGFDWVLNGILAGHPPNRVEMAGWGVGGLLMEIPSRPLPRLSATKDVDPAALGLVVLAAGRASRMGEGGRHKLLAEFEGEPLVRRSVRQAIEAGVGPVTVITGHRSDEVTAALSALAADVTENTEFASGMASSLKAGLAAVEAKGLPGIMVLLADMPDVSSGDIAALARAYVKSGGKAIVRAVSDGQRGNPVILPAATFEALKALEGDIGARPVIESAGLAVIDVEIGAAARLDVDTPEAIVAAGGILKD
ncbi:4-diphosphocytidyl-2C-methyl-D-erythritol kinase [Rhizobium rosettiformans]|uniref:4-diphosphocytidyl-2C-methyl-D-erythritol kinase n=1 Tax=Rhizobium rosettiformans TaxID=1368430 RepID=A0ABX7EZ67_9HYPH|nr:molybdopterin-binding/glycosyltransferase family 2 protein [Rhizobium rosettiformans]QRF53225.1 4-diphosphocytidyl-2C-methyl-D-erythritol kinase [Rhizobium rosettiformans]